MVLEHPGKVSAVAIRSLGSSPSLSARTLTLGPFVTNGRASNRCRCLIDCHKQSGVITLAGRRNWFLYKVSRLD